MHFFSRSLHYLHYLYYTLYYKSVHLSICLTMCRSSKTPQLSIVILRNNGNYLSHMIDITWIALSRLSTALNLVIFINPVKRNLWDKVKVNEVTRYERAIKVWDPIDHIQWLHYCEWLVEMYSKYLLDIQYIYTHRDRIWSCSIKTVIHFSWHEKKIFCNGHSEIHEQTYFWG